jgi:hypothetical protein
MDDYWDSYDESILQVIVLIIIAVAGYHHDLYYTKEARNPSVSTGEVWTQHLLRQRHTARLQDVLRMPLETFEGLCAWLQEHGGLRDSRWVSAKQKLAIFLWIVAQGDSQRATAEIFQHSTETISR